MLFTTFIQRLFLVFTFLVTPIISFSQMCFNDILLEKPNEMLDIGTFFTFDSISPTMGTSHRIHLVEKDYLNHSKICGGNPPYYSTCGDIKDETITVIEGTELNNGIPCLSRDKVYIDVIDVKFSYTHDPSCGRITLKNISDPVNLSIFDPKNQSNSKIFELQKFVLSDLTTYQYIITNYKTAKIDTIKSNIGDEYVIPEGDYNIKLCLKASNSLLNQEVDLFLSNNKSNYIPIIEQYKTVGNYKGDSVLIGSRYIKGGGDFKTTIYNKKGCDSIRTHYHVNVKESKNILGLFNNSSIREIKVDSKNNTYFLAQFNNNKTDLDPSSDELYVDFSRIANFSEVLVKLSSTGDLVWVKYLTSETNSVYLKSFDISPDDKIYLAGEFRGSLDVDFDPTKTYTLTSTGTRDNVFAMCIDTDAKFVWAKHFPATLGCESTKILSDTQSNIYFSGSYRGIFDANPGIGEMIYTSGNYSDLFLIKLDKSGNYLWSKDFKGTRNKKTEAMAIDKTDNSVSLTGTFQDVLALNPAVPTSLLTSNGYYQDIFIVKYTAAGVFQWSKQIGNKKDEFVVDIAIDQNSNICILGSFSDTLTTNTGVKHVSVSENLDVFLLKLNKNGEYLFSKSLGNEDYNSPGKLLLSKNNDIYLFQTFNNKIDLNPNKGTYLAESKDYKAYFIKLSSAGDFLWADATQSYYPSTASNVVTFTFDKENNIIAAFGTMNVWDTALLKIKQNCDFKYKTLTVKKCGDYNFNGLSINKTGFYEKIFKTTTCDSIVELNFTSVTSYSTTVSDSICANSVYNFGTQKLTKAGQYFETFTTADNCDSLVMLNLHNQVTSCDITAVNDPLYSPTFYPNPVTSVLHINNINIGSEISVFNSFGKIMENQKVKTSNIELSVSELPAGIYLIRIGNQSFKIKKE